MTTNLATHRSIIALVATAFVTLLISLAQAQQITPKTVTAGTPAALTINSSGFFDLSQVSAARISVNPGTGVSNIRISNATPTSATVTFDLASSAKAGQRMLVINAGDVTVSLKFSVEPAAARVCNPSNCRPPKVCDGDKCVPPACSAANCRPPRSCNDDGICALSLICIPRCRPTMECKPGPGGINHCEPVH
jgi:hypothetical protein